LTQKKYVGKLRDQLSQPLTRGLDLDDPKTTELRRKILAENKFLNRVYDEWYTLIIQNLPKNNSPVMEIGSGAGFLSKRIPALIQSDILYYPGLSLVFDGGRLPFDSNSLGSIILINTFHHIPDISPFLSEVGRTLKENGRLIMMEPWVTPWSSWVYKNFHHEPFAPDMKDWAFPSTGPLSCANGALPWIVFHRDLARFKKKFNQFSVIKIIPIMPILYLFSGGVAMRPLLHEKIFNLAKSLDSIFYRLFKHAAMFALITIQKSY
jgi:SAM-dependent methyltransferase